MFTSKDILVRKILMTSTTNEGCELSRLAPFCKKCSKTRVLIFKIRSPQNVSKHGVFGHFEKGINYD